MGASERLEASGRQEASGRKGKLQRAKWELPLYERGCACRYTCRSRSLDVCVYTCVVDNDT